MDKIAWANETFAPMKLIWSELPPIAKYPNDNHIMGLTLDKVAGIDLVLTDKAVRLATLITPVNAAYMPLCTYTIAVIADVTKLQADMWLAKMLGQLKVQRKKETQATISKIKGVASITSIGVFTLVLAPR